MPSYANDFHTSQTDSVRTLRQICKLVPLTTNINAWEEPDGSIALCIVFQYEGHLDRAGGGGWAPQNTAEFTGPIEDSRMNQQNV